MNNIIDNSKFRLAMLPLRNPISKWQELYQETQKCWSLVWQSVYDHFQLNTALHIDGLIRQDEAAAIFYESKCIGMILLRELNFQIMNYRSDSYFKEWTEDDMTKLLQYGPHIFIGGYLSVHPDFRNFSFDFKFKQIFMNIMVRRFLESSADALSTVTRRDRGINKESLALGGQMIRENVPFFGGKDHVDLLVNPRFTAKEYESEAIKSFTNYLWENRIDWKNPATEKVFDLTDQLAHKTAS